MPRLLSLATAVPKHILGQETVSETARHIFGMAGVADLDRMVAVFGNAGINRRYSTVPVDWYEKPHGWTDRNNLYLEHALALIEEAARQALADAGLKPEDIDQVVTVSTTGIATPSLDALLLNRLPLRRDVRRLPIFGLGCAGGVLGLSRAADLARAAPKSRVLFLVVELCALCFRHDDFTKSNLVATALFGDGATAAVISCDGDGPALGQGGEFTWPQSLDIMGWDVADDGLKAIFSRDIPALGAARSARRDRGFPSPPRSHDRRYRLFRLPSRRRQGARRARGGVRSDARRARPCARDVARLRQHVGGDGGLRAEARCSMPGCMAAC